MANYRKATVLAEESATTAATKSIDITLKKIVSRFQIRFNSTNADHHMTAVHAKQISKVELVDGSDVLFSLSGQEIEGKMFYDYGRGPSYERETRNGVESYTTLDVLFGRKLWDAELAFDPTKFTNPQLKITHNRALGGSAPNAATLSVFADVFDEKAVSPSGFLRSTENYSFTSAASAAYEYIDLPTDYVLRRIYLMTSKADAWWENLVSNVKISEEGDTRIPLDVTGQELVSLVLDNYPKYEELLAGTMADAGPQTYYVTPTEGCYFHISPIGGAAGDFVETNAERAGGYQDLNASAAIVFRALVNGYIPHGVVPLDFGDPSVIEDWYDVTRLGSVRLIPYAAGSVTFNVILEQLRKY